MTKISVSLYLSGRGAYRNGYVGTVTRACRRTLAAGYQLTLVDVDDNPGLALNRGVLATPALEVRTPARTHLIVGDLGHETRLEEQLQRVTRE